MPSEPTVIYSAASTQQAHLLKGLLEQEGIAATVVNDAMQMAGGELPLGWSAAAQVVVADEHAAAARQFAIEFDRKAVGDTGSGESLEPEPLSAWPDWPDCPHCGQLRSARCPICGASRTDFLLADVQTSGDQCHVLLKCDDCDDLFRPEWYRLCVKCGHDYGDGIDATPDKATPFDLPKNLYLVIAFLLGGGLSLIAYFAWLLRSRGG